MASSTSAVMTPNPVEAPASIHALLDRLHNESSTQEASLGTYLPKPGEYNTSSISFDDAMRDKFIALDQDKCHFVYQLARAINAKNIVEVGTSFGVSTIYLALAVGSNLRQISAGGGGGEEEEEEEEGKCEGKVIATEKEESKAARARQYWSEASDELVTKHIDLRVGDLNETLKTDLPSSIDLVLLDIWAPVALPALKLLEPHFRPGTVVLVDNSIGSAKAYKELLAHLRDPGAGYTNLTLPYSKGLEMSVKI